MSYIFAGRLLCFLYIHNVFAGGLSAADWNVRGLGGGGSMPATDGTTTVAAAAVPDTPSSGVTLRGNKSKVLENRDLCLIVVSYIPKPLTIRSRLNRG